MCITLNALDATGIFNQIKGYQWQIKLLSNKIYINEYLSKTITSNIKKGQYLDTFKHIWK